VKKEKVYRGRDRFLEKCPKGSRYLLGKLKAPEQEILGETDDGLKKKKKEGLQGKKGERPLSGPECRVQKGGGYKSSNKGEKSAVNSLSRKGGGGGPVPVEGGEGFL